MYTMYNTTLLRFLHITCGSMVLYDGRILNGPVSGCMPHANLSENYVKFANQSLSFTFSDSSLFYICIDFFEKDVSYAFKICTDNGSSKISLLIRLLSYECDFSRQGMTKCSKM